MGCSRSTGSCPLGCEGRRQLVIGQSVFFSAAAAGGGGCCCQQLANTNTTQEAEAESFCVLLPE